MKIKNEVAEAIVDLKQELGVNFRAQFASHRGVRFWCKPTPTGAWHERPFGVASCGCVECMAYEFLDTPYSFIGHEMPDEVIKKALKILEREWGFHKFFTAFQGDERPLSAILRADGTVDLKDQPFREWLPN